MFTLFRHSDARPANPLVTIAVLIPLTAATYQKLWGRHGGDAISLSVMAGFIGMMSGLVFRRPGDRGLGFVPYAYTGAAVAIFWAAVFGYQFEAIGVASVLLGFTYTRMTVAIDHIAPEWSPAGRWLCAAGVFVAIFLQVATIAPTPRDLNPPIDWLVAVLGLLALFAWLRLLRPAVELAAVPLVWFMYCIRTVGPGLAQVPARGPCVVIANHACWLDPVFLGKLLPRPITPMMTSKFYDLPVLSWLMRRVIHAIRVPEVAIKKDIPDEVQQAIAALDRGECLVIFPEGTLRRSETKPLSRFGRGVWHILAARPETPVFACWIEGGWGSYFSHFHGKPTQNKRPDFRHPIGVGMLAPVTVDADTLSNHLRTRLFLMNRVADARVLLGLPALPPFELPKSEADDETGGD